MDDRSVTIKIDGDDYQLLLTTRATREIANKHGGMDELGDKLMKSEDVNMALGEVVWLITLLANQSILKHNLKNKDNKRDLLTEEEVELRTTPIDLTDYKNAILEAMTKATQRNVESEDEPNSKNTEVE